MVLCGQFLMELLIANLLGTGHGKDFSQKTNLVVFQHLNKVSLGLEIPMFLSHFAKTLP